MDHTYQSDRGKSLLLNGSESRVRESNLVHLRWNTTTQWMLEVEAGSGRTGSNSDLLLGRTFAIKDQSTAPKLTWQPNTRMRGSLRFKYTDKRNDEDLGGERAEVRDLEHVLGEVLHDRRLDRLAIQQLPGALVGAASQLRPAG